jgi:hypothetical protein
MSRAARFCAVPKRVLRLWRIRCAEVVPLSSCAGGAALAHSIDSDGMPAVALMHLA